MRRRAGTREGQGVAHRQAVRHSALIVGATLLVAACSPSASPLSPPTSGDSTQNATTAPTASLNNPPSIDTSGMSPLDAALAPVNGTVLSPDDQLARADEQERWNQDQIARCMKDQGFDYTPRTPSITFFDELKPDDRTWVAEHGYAVTTTNNPRKSSAPAPDPNADYVASLSAAESRAYYEALQSAAWSTLYSDAPSMPKDGLWYPGCNGWALYRWSLAHPTFDPQAQDEFTPLFEAIDAFYASLDETPDGVPAPYETAWAQCMTVAGYPDYDFQRDARAQFQDAYWQAEAVAGGTSAEDEARWAHKEIDLALTDLDCRESTNYTKQQQAAQWAAEAQFVADHKGEFAALKLAAEQAGVGTN
jgi:hypothetical protein